MQVCSLKGAAMESPVDCAVVGGGISGASLAYVLCRYTSVARVAVFEAAPMCGSGNSHPDQMSQTLHFGEIEEWYTPAEAVRVRDAAAVTIAYLERHPDPHVWRRVPQMLLAVGEDDVRALEERHLALRDAFPELRVLRRHEIAAREPAVVHGRAPHERIAALAGDLGYMVDFQALARQLLRDARGGSVQLATYSGTRVLAIARERDAFTLTTTSGVVVARAVAVASGGFGLVFAHANGLAASYAILPVAGRFAIVDRPLLRGKVYTMQRRGVPFTQPHGDPDIHHAGVTRFGPTAIAVPCLDWHNPRTVVDWLRATPHLARTLVAFAAIFLRPTLLRYALWSAVTLLPWVGRSLFARACRRIVPTLTAADCSFARPIGGTRPQLVDIDARAFAPAGTRIAEDGMLVVVAPSPGASTALAAAADDAAYLCNHLGARFDRERFALDHTRAPTPDAHPHAPDTTVAC